MTFSCSPSKPVRAAVVIAFAGVISAGISPGTFAIVVSEIRQSLDELVGLSGVLSSDSQPAVNISSPDDIGSARSASISGFLNTGVLVAHASSDFDGSPGIELAAADATVNGLSGSAAAPGGGSLLSFGASSVGHGAGGSGVSGGLPRLGTASPVVGAPLPVTGRQLDIVSGGCSDEAQAQREDPQENSSPRGNDSCRLKIALNEQIFADGGVDPGSVTANIVEVPVGGLPSGNGEIVVPNSQAVLGARPVQSGDGPSQNTATLAVETQALTPAQEIPAPAPLLLLLAGMPGLLLLRCRRTTDGSTG